VQNIRLVEREGGVQTYRLILVMQVVWLEADGLMSESCTVTDFVVSSAGLLILLKLWRLSDHLSRKCKRHRD
jgi:hypothetical protein